MFALLCLPCSGYIYTLCLIPSSSQITTGVSTTFTVNYHNCCSPARSHKAAKPSVYKWHEIWGNWSYPEDGDRSLVRNVSTYIPFFTVSYPPRRKFLLVPLWQPQISRVCGKAEENEQTLFRRSPKQSAIRKACLLTLFMPLPMAAPLCGVFTCRLRPATCRPAGADRYDPTHFGRGSNQSSRFLPAYHHTASVFL
jgi:hypothetical protein